MGIIRDKGIGGFLGKFFSMNVNKEESAEEKKAEESGLKCSKNLISYFAGLGKDDNYSTEIDIKYVKNHFTLGADVNFGDKYGQTPLHEAARGVYIL